LGDVDRYLRAIERRLDVLPDKPQRDAELMARCRSVEAEFDDLAATVAPSADVEALAWSLEELRVSSFAQHLRTPTPVSEKRIRKEIHRLARGL
jgi:ATP-dependent helicase HrpA